MSSFDFTALIQFIMSLFEAVKALAEKLGIKIGGNAEETTAA